LAPDASWHDFFVSVAAAGAALTGLVFIAIALNPRLIAETPELRARARAALGGFSGALFIGLVVLSPYPFHRLLAAGLGLFGLGTLAGGIRLQLGEVRHQVPSWPFFRWCSMALAAALVSIGGFGAAATESDSLDALLGLAALLFFAVAIWQSWLLVLQADVPASARLR
jgi:hypothetical protein